MASDEEDEELAALRFAALASMKSKKPVEEDEDLKRLKEAALRSLEKIVPVSSHSASIHPPHNQSHSPNYYHHHPQQHPPQYGQTQYSQPQYQATNIPTTTYQQSHFRGNPLKQVSGVHDRKPGSRGGTPPGTRDNGGRGRGRGNPPRGLPPRANNLIVINPMPAEGEAVPAPTGNVPVRDTSTSKPVLIRPQDKWCASENNSQTASPSRPKASGKFSRFETSSGSESEESESEEETTQESKIEKSRDSDADSETEKKLLALSDIDSSSDDESAKSNKSNSDSKSSASGDSSDSSSDNSDSEDSGKEVTKKQEFETEEEKQDRREADRLLEETIDSRRVTSTDSEKEMKDQPKWTSNNFSVAIPSGGDGDSRGYDLSHKLKHHRARAKEHNGQGVETGDLSTKLKNRKSRKEKDENNSASVIQENPEKNIIITKTVREEPPKPSKPKLSEEALLKLEARKRKFESSPSTKDSKKTISLKGIVPRSKKRQKENPKSRSPSPVPKCYSRDLERFEKKKATKVRHKSSSKENRDHKKEEVAHIKGKTELKHKHEKPKEQKGKKNSCTKDSKWDTSSDESVPEEAAPMSDSESEDEGRSWRTESNKSRTNLAPRDRARIVRGLDEPSRQRRDYHDNRWNRRPEDYRRQDDRRRRNDESRIDVILPKQKRGERHRNVKVLDENESDSDAPKISSSIVMPGRSQTAVEKKKDRPRRKEEPDEFDSDGSDSTSRKISTTRKRTVVTLDSPDRVKPPKGSRRVTTDPDCQLTRTFRRDANFESRAKSPVISVTLDSEKQVSEVSRSRSHSSVHERLGRQLNVAEVNVERTKPKYGDEERKKKKSEGKERTKLKDTDESSKPDDDLELRIQKIKEKNAAILKRQEEVRKDKERYG